MNKPLEAYRAKRDFTKTPEPSGGRGKADAGNSYVIQKHAARRLHYDFRLELDGVLKSWAVPEGPSLVPGVKRLAVHVEDHPLEYGGFEGVIPEGEYGGGTVMIWDRGTWAPDFDPQFGYKKGHLKFHLNGAKLRGQWHLVRMARKPREKQEAWLLFKSDDEAARRAGDPDILAEDPLSAATGRAMEEIAHEKDRVWSSAGKGEVTQKPARKRRKVLSLDPAAIAKAKSAALPAFAQPSLPSLVEKAASGPGWVHEIKYDGYRVQARIESGRVRLLTRTGLDWTERFKSLAKALADLPVKSALIDGEIVVESESGVASFTALVDALKSGRGNLVLYAFDLLYLDGFDLREATLTERKETLARIVTAAAIANLRYSEHIAGDGDTIFRHACRLGLEGIVSKRAAAPYRSGRVKTWLKVKCSQHGSFVIAGFIPSTVTKNAIGALVLGEYVKGILVPSGHVGTGFNAEEAASLFRALDPLRTKTPPLKDETAEAKGAKWVEPVLVVEVEYRTRTGSDVIRHAVFRTLVEGAEPKETVRPVSNSATAPNVAPPSMKLTNPSRLLWPEDGVTKQGLADYYAEIADWILPHIVDRPLSLLRCPAGIHEECFFQKHRWAGLGKAVRMVAIPDEEPMLAIDDLEGLLELVQAGVLEIHPWGSRAATPALPDRVTIDLDPGEGVPWEKVVGAALEVRDRLSGFGLTSFVKTTGGKGLHVVFPISPAASWDAAKAFAQRLAEGMAAEHPDRYTANMAKRVRTGRIYVDYLRNGMGATAVGAYSTRARPGATVSAPLAWDELGPDIRPNRFTVENLPKRLAFLDADPWEGIASLRQTLPEQPAPEADPAPPSRRNGARARTEGGPSFPADAAAPSKEALAAYWKKVAKPALIHLARRPLRLVRRSRGKILYHTGPLPDLPSGVKTLRIGKREGGDADRPWIDSLEGLLGLVDIDVVEIHPWGATVDDVERPDMLVFGLDPGTGLEWSAVVEAAFQLQTLLQAEGLEPWPKLTGAGSLDVMVPVEPDLNWDEAHGYAREIAEKMANIDPGYVTSTVPKDRRGKLLIDWLRNSRGATAIGAYSPRARPGFPVAAPVTWRELQRIEADAFTILKPPR